MTVLFATKKHVPHNALGAHGAPFFNIRHFYHFECVHTLSVEQTLHISKQAPGAHIIQLWGIFTMVGMGVINTYLHTKPDISGFLGSIEQTLFIYV